jgi:NAD(P)-dependent dehydrogenase (short-subunit alcohol dehydrogenase family)
MKAGFSLHYRIVELEQDKRMLMTVNSKLFTAREEILFGTTKTGTTVRTRSGKAPWKACRRPWRTTSNPPRHPVAWPWRTDWFCRVSGASPGWDTGPRVNAGNPSPPTWKAVTPWLLAAAKELASLGATVTLVARNEIKARKTAKQLQQHTGNSNIGIEIADMSLMTDVHALCDRLLAAGKPVDMLINNAGALFNPRQQTAEGLEKSFALLLLGPYILTERLHPLLVKSDSPRVVNVSSGGMYSQKIHVNDLQSQKGSYSGSVAYAVNAMHPGWADTPGVETALPGFYKVTRRFLRSPEEGADTIVWLAASTEAAKVTGEFWLDHRQPKGAAARAARNNGP